MVGIFDSGRGGLFALSEFRKLSPRSDAAFFADTENAPYGTKSEGELVALVTRDIERLAKAGASAVLMACCTASTVYGKLPSELQSIAIPIIRPAAMNAVSRSSNKIIGVISTAATAGSRAFEKEIAAVSPEAKTVSVAAGELVSMVERGIADGSVTPSDRAVVARALLPILEGGADTVILGCTHFSWLEKTIADIGGMNVVNAARIGAELLAACSDNNENGKTLYIT